MSAVGFSARRTSLEDACAIGAELYYPHLLTPLAPLAAEGAHGSGPRRRLTFTATAARLGPVTAGMLSYSSAMRIDTAPYEHSYQVNLPLHGVLRTAVGEQHVEATSVRAAVYGPDVPTAISGWEQPCVMLAIKLDRYLVAERFTAEFGGDPEAPIPFPAELETERGVGRAWIDWVRQVIATSRRMPELDPGITAYLAERCVDGFIASVSNSAFEASGTACHSFMSPKEAGRDAAVVSRALEAITYASGQPLSLGAIAAYAGASARSVQIAFRSVLGETPMRLQRKERLRRVHHDLLSADPSAEQVSAVALRHGFTHMGRFSAQYHREHGELPSATLQR